MSKHVFSLEINFEMLCIYAIVWLVLKIGAFPVNQYDYRLGQSNVYSVVVLLSLKGFFFIYIKMQGL